MHLNYNPVSVICKENKKYNNFLADHTDTNHAAQVNNGIPQKGSVCVS